MSQQGQTPPNDDTWSNKPAPPSSTSDQGGRRPSDPDARVRFALPLRSPTSSSRTSDNLNPPTATNPSRPNSPSPLARELDAYRCMGAVFDVQDTPPPLPDDQLMVHFDNDPVKQPGDQSTEQPGTQAVEQPNGHTRVRSRKRRRSPATPTDDGISSSDEGQGTSSNRPRRRRARLALDNIGRWLSKPFHGDPWIAWFHDVPQPRRHHNGTRRVMTDNVLLENSREAVRNGRIARFFSLSW